MTPKQEKRVRDAAKRGVSHADIAEILGVPAAEVGAALTPEPARAKRRPAVAKPPPAPADPGRGWDLLRIPDRDSRGLLGTGVGGRRGGGQRGI